MLKKIRLQVILTTLIVMVSLMGCSKEDETKIKDTEVNANQVQETEPTNQESEQGTESTNQENEQDEFDVYEHLINIEYRGADINSAFRNPSSYTGEKFTFSGTVLDSQTSDDGIQTVIVELDTLSLLEYGEAYEEGTIIKLDYDIAGFGGQRLVKDDRLAICAEFKDIKNDSQYGDIAEFEALAVSGIIDYLSSLALNQYFKSIGVDIKNIGLHLEEFNDYEELGEIIGVNTALYYGEMGTSSVFSTESGVYWLASYEWLETGEYGIQLFSGEKDKDGEVIFNYKEDVYFYSYEF